MFILDCLKQYRNNNELLFCTELIFSVTLIPRGDIVSHYLSKVKIKTYNLVTFDNSKSIFQ